jgi:photosynthetic reaction center cytochrome c subunit
MTRSLAAALAWTAVAAVAPMQPAPAPEHARTRAYNIALGVGCEHCHGGSNFADRSKPILDFARRMERMVGGLNDGPLKALGGVTCWSCHRGHTAPPRLPRAAWESIAAAHAPEFAGRDQLSLAMSVYSASLGVGCEHCHVEGDRTSTVRRPHRTVAVMLTVFDVIPTFFDSAVRAPRTQCYMCHQGHTAVERNPA